MKRLLITFWLALYGDPLLAQNPSVEPLDIWQNYASRTDWAKLIAFDYYDSDGFFDLAICNSSKTNFSQLTKDVAFIPQRHIGNPTYHPSGRYIIFQALKDSSLGGEENKAWVTYVVDSYFGSPGKGFDNDLYCVDLNDTSFHRLTTLPTKKFFFDTTKVTGILHPHFSKSGTKVLWAQAYDGLADIGGRGKWGLWQLNISDFVLQGSTPSLGNTVSFKPGGLMGDFTWCESHGWTNNDSVVIFSMNSEGQHETHMDIYTLNIYDSTLTRLTDKPKTWDEHAHLTHNEDKFLWICSETYDFDSTRAEETLRTDYWIMDIDGNNKKRVTFFNDPAYPDYQIHGGQRVICADASFSPSGDSLLINTKVPDDTVTRVYEKILLALYHEGSTDIEFLHELPEKFILYQNHPNPFNTTTKLVYALNRPGFVSMKIYDILGREIRTLVYKYQEAGAYSIIFDPGNIPSGIYFYVLQVEKNPLLKKKMLLLR